MNEKMPRTPFSTPLSGSARLAELRIRNIFAGPKKRPPVPLMILAAALCLLCGNLVSCNQRPKEPTLVMETQYYDSYGNYLEPSTACGRSTPSWTPGREGPPGRTNVCSTPPPPTGI